MNANMVSWSIHGICTAAGVIEKFCSERTTRHRANTEHSLAFRIRAMLSYREVEASLLLGWSLTSLFSTNTAISEMKASL